MSVMPDPPRPEEGRGPATAAAIHLRRHIRPTQILVLATLAIWLFGLFFWPMTALATVLSLGALVWGIRRVRQFRRTDWPRVNWADPELLATLPARLRDPRALPVTGYQRTSAACVSGVAVPIMLVILCAGAWVVLWLLYTRLT